jgi:hypothetical protein
MLHTICSFFFPSSHLSSLLHRPTSLPMASSSFQWWSVRPKIRHSIPSKFTHSCFVRKPTFPYSDPVPNPATAGHFILSALVRQCCHSITALTRRSSTNWRFSLLPRALASSAHPQVRLEFISARAAFFALSGFPVYYIVVPPSIASQRSGESQTREAV